MVNSLLTFPVLSTEYKPLKFPSLIFGTAINNLSSTILNTFILADVLEEGIANFLEYREIGSKLIISHRNMARIIRISKRIRLVRNMKVIFSIISHHRLCHSSCTCFDIYIPIFIKFCSSAFYSENLR